MSEFYEAPITHGLLWATGLGTFAVLSGLVDPNSVTFDMRAMREVGRLFTSVVVPGSPLSGLVTMGLLYQLRNVERYLGPGRFGGFVLGAAASAQPLCLAALLLFAPSLKKIEGGPIAIAFAMVAVYQMLVPALGPPVLEVGGLRITRKGLFVAACFLAGLSQGPAVVVPGLSGMLFAGMWRHGAIPQFSLPRWVQTGCARTFGHLFTQPPAWYIAAERRIAVERQRDAAVRGFQQQRGLAPRPVVPGIVPPHHHREAPHPPQPQNDAAPHDILGQLPGAAPDPEKVEHLMALGFPREEVERALAVAHNDETAAANILLGQ